ncbi:MAG: T9SS type A sorting domain-containing protein [Saprospiraceae bacterium]|nr:T9SS type A sorting domain-containing protein [Saprospiraceae bacterium]
MQKYIIAISILLFVSNLNSQHDFEWDYQNEYTGLFTDVYFNENENRIIALARIFQNRETIINIFKSNDGDLINTKIFPDTDLIKEFHKIIHLQRVDQYLLLGLGFKPGKDLTQDSSFICTILLDKNFSILSNQSFFVTNHGYLFHINYHITEEEKILFIANSYKDYGNSGGEMIYGKIDFEGKLLNFEKRSSVIFIGGPIVPSNIDSGYYCFSRNTYTFDSDFNFTNKIDTIFIFMPANHNKVISWGDYYLGGSSAGGEYNEYKSGSSLLFLMDNDLNIIKYTGINQNLKFSTSLPANVFDITKDSSIYLGNCDSPFEGYLQFSVQKFDKSLNTLWRLDFSREGEYRYRMWGVKATPEGGVIIYGSRILWGDDSRLRPYFIKFNAEGNLVSTSDNDYSGLRLVRVYPNPVSDICTIHLTGYHDGCDIRLYDMNGRNVYDRHDARDGEYQIDMSSLSSGQYIYKIYQSDKEVSSGQIVKI